MDKENYNALQIVPNFSFGLELFEDTDPSSSATDAELQISLQSEDPGNIIIDNTNTDSDSHRDEIQRFLHESSAKSTLYKDVSAETRFEKFLTSLNPFDVRKIHQIPPTELDQILSKFFMSANKIDKNSIKKLGELYQPDSLSSFLHCWQRILSSRESKINIKKDKEFEAFCVMDYDLTSFI